MSKTTFEENGQLGNILDVREIQWKSKAYKQELELRNEVLRKPLGLNLFDQDLSLEEGYYRIGAFWGEELAGVLLVVPLQDVLAQMKQMAVKHDMQGRQVGRRIILFAEALLREKGYEKVTMNARKYAVPFYEKQGYRKVGEEFLEVGIPHFVMEKNLGC